MLYLKPQERVEKKGGGALKSVSEYAILLISKVLYLHNYNEEQMVKTRPGLKNTLMLMESFNLKMQQTQLLLIKETLVNHTLIKGGVKSLKPLAI